MHFDVKVGFTAFAAIRDMHVCIRDMSLENMDDVSMADLSPSCLFVHTFLSSELFVVPAMITSSIILLIGVRAHPQHVWLFRSLFKTASVIPWHKAT